ncbi:MAG: radical SAM protein [Clostridia bacterium]|nr:radical SAM protein [Clostridia bacterium]
MITIAEPKELIDKLWGKQKIREDDTYRLMRYVLRVDHEDKVLLHNVVTGRLVVLEREEAEALETLPAAYNPTMEQLVTEHYLVPETFDEHQQVINLRKILRSLDDAHKSDAITKFAILPTTACNARCYYCFEHGIKAVSMDEQMAKKVAGYIIDHCGGEKVYLTWFGGEPTVSANRIDQICEILRSNGIEYQSNIITNGYLLGNEMSLRAKSLWNLKTAQISVDGGETNTNRIKSFVGAKDNPYQQVLRNVEMLIRLGIKVSIRMNFDLNNYQDFKILLKDLLQKVSDKKLLQVVATPVLGEYVNNDGVILHGDDKWMEEKIVDLNDMARDCGLLRFGSQLPHLEFSGCSAADKTYTIIGPSGKLFRCLECVHEYQSVGDIDVGVTIDDLYESWKELADYDKCRVCSMFPWCMKMKNCSSNDRCYQLDHFQQCDFTIRNMCKQFMNKEDDRDGISGAESGVYSN